MKKIILNLAFIFFTINLIAQNQIIGKWLTEDKEAITEIYQQNGKFYGKIVWLKKPNDDSGKPVTDTENPDSKLKQRQILNLIIIKDLSYKDNEWSGGTVYDPDSGKTYTCKLWITDNNTMKVRGYIGFFYETETWIRQ